MACEGEKKVLKHESCHAMESVVAADCIQCLLLLLLHNVCGRPKCDSKHSCKSEKKGEKLNGSALCAGLTDCVRQDGNIAMARNGF